MEYCYHVWAGSNSCYLEMLDRLQKLVGRPIAVSLESQPSSVFYLGITLANVHLNWLIWLHFSILVDGPLVILIGCVVFLTPFFNTQNRALLTKKI